MDAEHKIHIAELEARAPGRPPEEREARVEELQGYADTIEVRLAEMQKLPDEATNTWTTMEDIDGLIDVREALQKNQKELDELTMVMKDVIPLQRMLKIGESKRLQTKLRAKEVEYLQTLQPWKEQVSEIVIKINVKLTKFHATQTTVARLLTESPTTDLVNAARESVDQMTQEIATLQQTYTKISTEIQEIVKGPKDDVGGSGTSHK